MVSWQIYGCSSNVAPNYITCNLWMAKLPSTQSWNDEPKEERYPPLIRSNFHNLISSWFHVRKLRNFPLAISMELCPSKLLPLCIARPDHLTPVNNPLFDICQIKTCRVSSSNFCYTLQSHLPSAKHLLFLVAELLAAISSSLSLYVASCKASIFLLFTWPLQGISDTI